MKTSLRLSTVALPVKRLRNHDRRWFLLSAFATALLGISTPSVQAILIAADSFGGPAGNLVGDGGGLGFSGVWTAQSNATHGTFAVQSTGLSMPGVSSSGGSVQFTADSNNGGVTVARTFGAPLAGTFYGSYLFSINVAGLANTASPVGGVGTGAVADADGTASFFWAGDGYGIQNPAVRAEGTAWPGTNGNNLASGTTYLFLSYTDTAANTTTGWVLTAAQLSNFVAGSTLDVAHLNTASVGTAATNVFAKRAATAASAVGAQGSVILEGFNNGQTAYSFTFDEIRFSNTSLAEAITASVPVLSPSVKIPTLNTNEAVVATATPQQFGAIANDGVDDTQAFQNALNAIFNAGSRAGGVLYVPAGHYTFNGNLTIPQGVTVHGDWKDWTTTVGGAVGTIFDVYTSGAATGTPFITMTESSGLKGVTFWYPNQNAGSIQPYPFTVKIGACCTIQNAIFVNAYQGISTEVHRATLSTVIGTALKTGVYIHGGSDPAFMEDLRFSPAVWPLSGLTGAPAANGPHQAWMRANGVGMVAGGCGGQFIQSVAISGYQTGIWLTEDSNAPSISFYQGTVTDCGTAVMADRMQVNGGTQFAWFTLSGDVGIDRAASATGIFLQLSNCAITGTNGTAIHYNGPGGTGSNDRSWMQLTNCAVSGTILQEEGVLNVVNTQLTVGSGPHCTLNARAVRAAFTGCTPGTPMVVNNVGAGKVVVDSRPAIPNQLPLVDWATVKADCVSRKPAKTTLFVATTGYGAVGDGTHDDTVNIQNALNSAGANAGGIVYLPGGHYKTTGSLTIPSGVELRGVYELRHECGPWIADGLCKASVLQPTGGQGSASGPPAIVLSANSGVVGVDVNYETQSATAPVAFPPAVQGRGDNIYVMSMVCPNAYAYVDFDTYPCRNHLVFAVEGCALTYGFKVGNGSQGKIVNTHLTDAFWRFLQDSASVFNGAVDSYLLDHHQMFVLGNCDELLVKAFSIFPNALVHGVSQNGVGPRVTGVHINCDIAHYGFLFDTAGTAAVKLVNTLWMTPNYPTSTDAKGEGLLTTSSAFQGVIQLFNTANGSFGARFDFNVGGGNVIAEGVYLNGYADGGSVVTGGALHLINLCGFSRSSVPAGGAGDIYNYPVSFGAAAGLPGAVSEMVGFYTPHGLLFSNANAGDPIDLWSAFASNSTTVQNNVSMAYENLNLGLNRPATASSTATGTPASVNDGNSSTRWGSSSTDNEWIYIDLLTTREIGQVSLNWEAAYGKDFKVQVSDNPAGSWTDAASVTGWTGGSETVLANGAGRYVRMLGIHRGNTSFGYALWEMGINCNLAQGRPVVASSTRTQTPPVPTTNVNDGNFATRWSSNATNNEWVYIDLQSVRQISSVVLDWEAAYATSYKIQVSNDLSTWTDVYSTTQGVGGIETIPVSATGRYVRMLGLQRATGYGYSLWEFEVY